MIWWEVLSMFEDIKGSAANVSGHNGKSCQCWIAVCLCTAQLQDMGSYVFVYCPGSRCG